MGTSRLFLYARIRMVRDPEAYGLVRNIMAEAEDVAAKLGMELPVTIEPRIAGAEKVGKRKTSMLLVGAVVELGERLGVGMPHSKTVYASARLLDQISRGQTSTGATTK